MNDFSSPPVLERINIRTITVKRTAKKKAIIDTATFDETQIGVADTVANEDGRA